MATPIIILNQPHPSALLNTFAITMPNGESWRGELYQTRTRASGRRIIVRDPARRPIFDTDDAYDVGNARNTLDLWLEAQAREQLTAATVNPLAGAAEPEEPTEPLTPAEAHPCDQCGELVGPDDDGQRTEATTLCVRCMARITQANAQAH